MRTEELANDSIYHVYNRGVDKREVFLDNKDLERFLTGLREFNNTETIGSIYEQQFNKEKTAKPPLVKIIAYGLISNHYHLILQQEADRGIEKLMHKLGTGQTKYFNHKYRRTGSLFGGTFKARLVEDNEDLLNLSVYVNLNPEIHQHCRPLGSLASKWVRTSLREYENGGEDPLSKPAIILEQFKDFKEYREFTTEAFHSIVENKLLQKDLEYDLEA